MERSQKEQATDRRCTWCGEAFASRAEQELHVSLLGAPGEFHPACYEEYLRTSEES